MGLAPPSGMHPHVQHIGILGQKLVNHLPQWPVQLFDNRYILRKDAEQPGSHGKWIIFDHSEVIFWGFNMISTWFQRWLLQLLPRDISSLHCSHLLFGHCRWGGRRGGCCGSRRSDNVAHVHQDAVACGPDGALAKLAKLVRAKHFDGVYGRYICLYFIGFVSLVYVCMYACMHVCMYACMHVCIYASMHLCIYASMHLCIYASMHVCMYACMHVCMYACIHVCMQACMHASMHVCMYACMHVCMYACMHVCMYACMYACMHVCMYACMYECIHVFMYVWTYERMNVWTYEHINVWTYERMYVCTYVRMYVCTYVRMCVCAYVRMYVCTYVCMLCYVMFCYVMLCYACMYYVCMYACMYVRLDHHPQLPNLTKSKCFLLLECIGTIWNQYSFWGHLGLSI